MGQPTPHAQNFGRQQDPEFVPRDHTTAVREGMNVSVKGTPGEKERAGLKLLEIDCLQLRMFPKGLFHDYSISESANCRRAN